MRLDRPQLASRIVTLENEIAAISLTARTLTPVERRTMAQTLKAEAEAIHEAPREMWRSRPSASLRGQALVAIYPGELRAYAAEVEKGFESKCAALRDQIKILLPGDAVIHPSQRVPEAVLEEHAKAVGALKIWLAFFKQFLGGKYDRFEKGMATVADIV